jgi:hypothetical protein
LDVTHWNDPDSLTVAGCSQPSPDKLNGDVLWMKLTGDARHWLSDPE